MTIASPITCPTPRGQFDNAAQWLIALGSVPLARILFKPWPGSATEADVLRLLENEKRLCELVDQTLVEKPVGFWEGRIAARIVALLELFVGARNLGAVFGADTTMRMKSGRVRMPDASFVSRDRLPKSRAPIPSLAPDLAVEVLSEGNTVQEMRLKLDDYFDSGSRLVWLVDPASRSVSVHTNPAIATAVLTEVDALDGGDVLPGLLIPVEQLFRDLPPD